MTSHLLVLLFFIEPAAVVKLNNDIRELELKEASEIEVILADLSVKAGEHTEELLCNYEILVELDCIFAKAQLARHMHASRPVNEYIRNYQYQKRTSPTYRATYCSSY